MFWVILGHAYAFPILFPFKDMLFISEVFERNWFPIIYSGFFAVDSFFFLSGFLATYLMISRFLSMRSLNVVKLFMIYFHRFFRILPLVALVCLFTVAFYGYIGDGPSWVKGGGTDALVQGCVKEWYITLLFLVNLVNIETGCMSWTWYLANDMQFFLILPFILYLFAKNRKYGYYLVGLLLLANIICTMVIAQVKGAGVNLITDQGAGSYYIYYRPWTRITTYLVGIFFGLMYWEFKNAAKHNLGNSWGNKFYTTILYSPLIRHMCFAIGLILTALVTFVPIKDIQSALVRVWPQWASTIY
jgi:peptidoglycan/LPS O-acetylase OafA/YrhL